MTNKFVNIAALSVALLGLSQLHADENPYIKSRILSGGSTTLCSNNIKCKNPLTKSIYNAYSTYWIDGNKVNKTGADLISNLENSKYEGLNSKRYNLAQIKSLVTQIKNTSKPDSESIANLDMLLTDSFFEYAHDLYYGQINSKKVFPDWHVDKPHLDLIKLFHEALANKDVSSTFDAIKPTYVGYDKLKEALAFYLKQDDFTHVPDDNDLNPGDTGDSVLLLQKRLTETKELDSDYKKGTFDKNTEKAVMKFQENHGLYNDGIVGSDTLDALNMSNKSIIKKINLNLDKMRLFPMDMGDKYIVVNIPAYSLNAYNGNHVLPIDVVVGTSKRQSCVLNSQIKQIEFNPYWNVPYSIASNDLLKLIHQKPDYLSRNNFQVFAIHDSHDTPIDPKSIDWSKVDSHHLAYKFRQEPGTINALGKIKFIFPNRCGIYLHDSPDQDLFDVYTRSFSHGCIRVASPHDLADFILADEDGWSSQKVTDLINNGKNKTISLKDPINLYIFYLTAWVDYSNQLQFRDDIYHLDRLALYPR